MLSYPVRLVPHGKQEVLLTFPDVPEAEVVGANEEDAFDKALPELEKALEGYVAKGRPIPRPSDHCGTPTVTTFRFKMEETIPGE